MDELITWVIIGLFYAPLHFAVPVLIVFVRETSADRRRDAIRRTLLDCTFSMTLAFALVIWLASDHLALAMGILLLSMASPYLRLLLHKAPA
jgi:hypothetical protein